MEEKVKILLCEDDENLGTLLCEYLIAKGYDATLCPDGEAGFKEFQKEKFDICILDVMMPKKDGFTLAQDIRQMNSQVPIIFLTARVQKEDVLEGFDKGADDYITKPFSMEELVKRVEAILRRVRGKKNRESTMYKIGRFTFDTQKQLLTIDGKSTKLTTKENELLALMIRSRSSTSTARAISSSCRRMINPTLLPLSPSLPRGREGKYDTTAIP